MLREFAKELQGTIARMDHFDRATKTPVRIPTSATEAAQLCERVLDHANLATVTTTEIALAKYLQELLAEPMTGGSGARLVNRTIARVRTLPMNVDAPLPLAVLIQFRDGGRLQFRSITPLVFTGADGSLSTFPDLPSEPSTDAIDQIIAVGVDASDKPRSGG